MAAATEARLARGRRLRAEGVVQGVGFRPHVMRLARRLGLTGTVWNDAGGVVVEAWGSSDALRQLETGLASEAPAVARVERVTRLGELAGPGPDRFEIGESRGAPRSHLSLGPDLSTCPECLGELFDPASRRAGYAFTTCTRCGPRYSVVRSLPYDRAGTTMARFEPCPGCRREHDDPSDRRLHAQSLACPRCGPRLAWLAAEDLAGGDPGAGSDPHPSDQRVLDRAVALLRAGGILAVHGLGGFHLACDATRSDAVARLRKRKRRERKPFAVMVEDVDAAESIAILGAEERRLLASPEAPIVLASLHPDASLAAEVAPGLARVGLLLPYTPLHHLLMRHVRAPLVMTSGNRSGEPLVWRRREALQRLGDVADGFLVHDREIAAPCDDSVAQVVSGAPQILRRSRGFVPRPIRLARPVPKPILAVGGQLHSSIALAVDDRVVLGPHGGDLESVEAVAAFEEGVDRLERLLGVEPEVVAHDRHPHYASTRYALTRGVEPIAVQHHHAHLASVLAESGHPGRALAPVWDGTGWGSDGHAWGGELLLGDARGFERVGTLRPLRLAGGERAIRSVWRQGLAILEDAYDGEPPAGALAWLDAVGTDRVEAVRELLRKDVACVRAHGAGRWFDAVGSLVLGCHEASWSGEVATRWGFTARGDDRPYAFRLEERAAAPGEAGHARLELDLRPMVRAIVADRLAGERPERIASRFHATLAAGAAAMIARVRPTAADLPVAISGGCFQNPLLTRLLCARLPGERVLRHREVPTGDGGLALGQVCVAAERIRDREG